MNGQLALEFQGPHENQGAELVGHDRGVGILPRQAGLLRCTQQVDEALALWLEDAADHHDFIFLEVLDFAEEHAHEVHVFVQAGGITCDIVTHDGRERRLRGGRFFIVRRGRGENTLEDQGEQVLFVLKKPEEGHLVHPRGLGDLAGGRRREPVPGKDHGGGIQQAVAGSRKGGHGFFRGDVLVARVMYASGCLHT